MAGVGSVMEEDGRLLFLMVINEPPKSAKISRAALQVRGTGIRGMLSCPVVHCWQ